ncbi:EpsG family protein [Fusobacterium perfoetens]|uniref:EpsG family protein n=1 Tax=Fusobacterium perfoetens TaxID=852 RepID=UPI003AF3283D
MVFLEIFPIFLILAFQNGIGTDYYSYIEIFNQKINFNYSRGPLFKILILHLKKFFDNERVMFITVAMIQIILYYKILNIFYKKFFIKNIHYSFFYQ